jgi:hypothetical protein
MSTISRVMGITIAIRPHYTTTAVSNCRCRAAMGYRVQLRTSGWLIASGFDVEGGGDRLA